MEAVLGNGAKTTQAFDVDADPCVFEGQRKDMWANDALFCPACLRSPSCRKVRSG